MNWYSYAKNNPLKYNDSKGLAAQAVAAAAWEGVKVVTGALEKSSKNNVNVSGNSLSADGKRGTKNTDKPKCSVEHKTFDVERIRGVDSWVYTFMDVQVQLYFKYDGCDINYLGVQVNDSAFMNGLWGEINIVGTPLGKENPVDGDCYCCDFAACAEYKIRIDVDMSWYVPGQNDFWASFKFVACGDGSIKKTYDNLSDNYPGGASDWKLGGAR
jgi:hypothetical protein